ncbi:hypothetical protein K435DRAFT_686417 [Dendrothele bispora CBS 962.96]|uniref:BRCT domain-containing protein n=1 Tax=Dendrothele bispora (strain CBS 962.96) TaxID=1314807 RepID=A0A4S8L8J2_DENBC|nr:hypothetical protein K435DRAFT_686417 [Dendrothele bispora CBS 962.96]
MGPPPTPPRREGLRNLRSSSSTYPSSSAGGSSSSSVANGNTNHSNSEQKEEKRKYGVLDKCKVFVDIRGEGGEDVASLFSESLEILGARIMTRVGSTCTHIVFKDGLPSTVNRYRLLNDPKPKVVGLTWVVECIEKMQHVDEEKFLIDLEEFKFATAHKRRKSMIPKMIPSFDSSEGGQEGDGDVSMESNSSMLDDLPPLERARLRQSMASRT